MRNAMDIATISCSVVSKVDQQAGVIEDVRITFGVAAPVPYRCTKAEEALKGMKIGLPNSILGAAVSLIKYLILMSCVFNVMSFLGIVSQAKAEESFLYEPVKNSLGYAFKAYGESHSQDGEAAGDSVYTENDSIQ